LNSAVIYIFENSVRASLVRCWTI